MDLAPFKQINPCGYPDLEVIQLADLIEKASLPEVSTLLIKHFIRFLGVEQTIWKDALPEAARYDFNLSSA